MRLPRSRRTIDDSRSGGLYTSIVGNECSYTPFLIQIHPFWLVVHPSLEH